MRDKRIDLTQRAVVLQVLSDEGCLHRSLVAALGDLDRIEVENALAIVQAKDIIRSSGDKLWPSGCLTHLDALGLIAV
jgi:hypothetical protein